MSGGHACRKHSLGFGVIARRMLPFLFVTPFSIKDLVAHICTHGATFMLVVAKPSVLPGGNP